MHKTDAANNVSNLFKSSPTPGTTVSHLWLNAVQQELANAIVAAGLTLSASGAADAAVTPTPYVQLLQAINRLARKSTWIEVEMDEGAGKNLPSSVDEFMFMVTGTNEPLGQVSTPNGPEHIGRTMLLWNNTDSAKWIYCYDGKYRIEMDEVLLMVGKDYDGTGTDCNWAPVGKLDAYKEHFKLLEDVHLTDLNGGDASGDVKFMEYGPGNSMLTMQFPALAITMGITTNYIYLSMASSLTAFDAEMLPQDTDSSTGGPWHVIPVEYDGANIAAIIQAYDGKWRIRRLDLVQWQSGAVVAVKGLNLTFMRNRPFA